jgi:D-alanine transaminase
VDEMMAADEIIVLSSGTLCRPAYMIDGVAVGGKAKDNLRLLQDHLMADYLSSTEKK